MLARNLTEETPRAGPDVLRQLGAFHGEIRTALSRAEHLTSDCEDSASLREEARQLSDFFAGPLLWHDIDEEALLMPPLRRLHFAPLDRVLDQLEREHEEMEAALTDVLFLLEDIAAARVQVDPARLSRATHQLVSVLLPHLVHEEEQLFPAARALLAPEVRSHLGVLLRRRDEARKARLPRPQ